MQLESHNWATRCTTERMKLHSHVLHRAKRRESAPVHIALLKVTAELCSLLAPFNWNLVSQETTTFDFASNFSVSPIDPRDETQGL